MIDMWNIKIKVFPKVNMNDMWNIKREVFPKVNMNDMWKIKRKDFPKNKESLPFAKKNCDGKLVSSHHQLKELYLDTFIHRLRHRPIKKDFSYLKFLKEKLCSKRLEYAKKIKTRNWTMKDLDKILKALKKNKSRDPHGFVNEIFKLEVIGFDLKNSLLMLFNRLKQEHHIPSFMQFADIVAILLYIKVKVRNPVWKMNVGFSS